MNHLLAELVGTALLVILGDGVVANVALQRSKGQNAGWIVVTAGWAFAVTLAVYSVNAFGSGAHLNPAVTLGLASFKGFPWADVPGYMGAQIAGGFLGAVVVWLAYLPHWRATEDAPTKLGVFCTAPAIRSAGPNLLCEIIGTAVLVFGLQAVLTPANLVSGTGFDMGFKPCLVGVLVWAIGLSLGGPTGYAINPARDLGPRLAHAVLPIAGKGRSDWSYAWIPVVGPLIGGVLGAALHSALKM